MTHVHLVGSIGLDTVQDVFATVGRILGGHVLRCPDGEVGGRRLWTGWQYPLLRSVGFLAPADEPLAGKINARLQLATSAKPGDVRFGELGYAREARTSYQDFLRARASGVFSPSTRFQVCLPTPFAVIATSIKREDLEKVEPAYEAAMVREIASLCEEIPHSDLSLQWDICPEMVMWDGRYPRMPRFEGIEPAMAARFRRLSAAVPSDVELGFHLCYGDLDAKHFVEPQDMTRLVEFANMLAENVTRPIAWLHMPVPRDRDDDAYFKPMLNLKRRPETELFLGLVHADGRDAIQRRMNAAKEFAPAPFGIGTECGMARARTRTDVEALLQAHIEALA